MPKTLKDPKRVNVHIEGRLHEESVASADAHELQGGFSELVARLLNHHLAGSGRKVRKMPRYFDETRLYKNRRPGRA